MLNFFLSIFRIYRLSVYPEASCGYRRDIVVKVQSPGRMRSWCEHPGAALAYRRVNATGTEV